MHKRFPIFVAICGVVLAIIYGISSSPLPSGYADSDELITAAFFNSVAHPPGFPLFIFTSHHALLLLRMFSPAQAANYLAGIYQAGATVFFFLLIRDLVRNHLKNHQNSIALATAGLAAFSYHWWLYATVFEITSFTNLLTTATVWCAYHWYQSSSVSNRWFWLTWILAGILLSHFQLAILLFPSLLILLLAKTKRITLIASGIGIVITVFGITNLPLFIQNQHPLPISWDFPNTVDGWMGHITRRDYTGFNPEVNTNFHTAFPTLSQFDQITLTSIGNYARDIWGYYSPLGIILALVGLVGIWKKDKLIAAVITAQYVLTGPFLAAYMRLSQYVFEPNLINGMGERQFVINQVSIGMYIGFGIITLATYYQKQLVKKPVQMYVLAICLIGIEAFTNRSLITTHTSRQTAYQLAQARLNQAVPGSLIICTNDVDCYSLLYLSNVLKIRPDVEVLPHVYAYKTTYLATHPDIYPYQDALQLDYFPQLLAWNIARRPAVYLTSGVDFYAEYVGWETGPFYLEPMGQLFKLTSTQPIITPPNTIPSFISSTTLYDSRDKYGKGILETIANSYAYAGFLSLKYQQVDAATRYFQNALTVDPQNEQAKTMYENRELFAEKFKTTPLQNTVNTYLKTAAEQEKNNNNKTAERLFRQATYIDPLSELAITSLSDFYARHNQPQLAAIYSQHLQVIQKYKKP